MRVLGDTIIGGIVGYALAVWIQSHAQFPFGVEGPLVFLLITVGAVAGRHTQR